MLQPGKHPLKEKINGKTSKKGIDIRNSDYLTDEENGYTQEIRDKIDEKLLNMPADKSLKLEDLLRQSNLKKHLPAHNKPVQKKGRKIYGNRMGRVRNKTRKPNSQGLSGVLPKI